MECRGVTVTEWSGTQENTTASKAVRTGVDIVLFLLVFALLTGIWAYLWVPPSPIF